MTTSELLKLQSQSIAILEADRAAIPWQAISDLLFECNRAGIDVPVVFLRWVNQNAPWAQEV